MTDTPVFTLSSPDLVDGKFQLDHFLSEPYGFGCAGGNKSPALSWSNPPAGTKSYVLTIYDKDAPTGFGWVHWVVVNIPADATGLPAGVGAEGFELPANAMQTRTDFGVPGYGGPCPPPGAVNEYVFTLTALGIDSLPEFITRDATPALVGFFAKANALGEASFSIRQGR